MDSDKLCEPVIKGRIDYSLYAGHYSTYISHPRGLWNTGKSNKMKIKLNMDLLFLSPMNMIWSPVYTLYYVYVQSYFFLANIKTFHKVQEENAQNWLFSNSSLTRCLVLLLLTYYFFPFTLPIYIAILCLYNFLLTYLKFSSGWRDYI